ncbi:hypothetical protein [Chryseobacterium jejuense]|uniref:hypothetical protein n=1 Tax=Chryseobacterium jejuense TaxID=445960 RepID=UPI001AE74CFB|nr:hypothetical protein [Chryseobacterium jejuense]MBP2619546.1 DNA helicase TIP49 (TBP-interacting protein) [Chryseobacterium jejuense]
MKRIYTLETFTLLDLDTKSFIIEDILYEEYLNRQSELFILESEAMYTEEVRKEHEILFENLIKELTLKLFENRDVIEFDLEKRELEVMYENEAFYNIIDREGSITIQPEDKLFNPKLN